MNDFRKLVQVCKDFGSEEKIVQGPGGNASIKVSDDMMLIKASGCNLSEVSEETGFVKVNYVQINDFYAETHDGPLATNDELAGKAHMGACGSSGSRPSMETGFHAALGRVVLHAHPVYTNMISCLQSGEDLMRAVFQDIDVIWIPYKSPGFSLTTEIRSALERTNPDLGKPLVFFLENHGLVVSADNVEVAKTVLDQVCSVAESFVLNKNIPEYMPDKLTEKEGYVESNNPLIVDYAKLVDKKGLHFVFPDAVVYGLEIFSKQSAGLRSGTIKYEYGLRKAVDVNAILNTHMYINLYGSVLGDVKFLSEEEISHLTNMSAEKYRKKLFDGGKI